jgi:hypothetical protein
MIRRDLVLIHTVATLSHQYLKVAILFARKALVTD